MPAIIKTIHDYYDQLYEKFPDVPKNDIKKIVNFGWRSLYQHNHYGGDVIVRDQKFQALFGKLTTDGVRHYKYYRKKLILKIRVLYQRRKIPWDGYYYFALTEKQYQEYYGQFLNKRGRPKKYFEFKNAMLYKIYDECVVSECYKQYIFRIPYLADMGFKFFRKQFKTDKVELILQRDKLKLKDMLVENNNYQVLNGNSSKRI